MSRCRCVAQGAILPGGDLDLDKLCIGLPEPRLLARALRQIGDKVTGLPPRWRRQHQDKQGCHQPFHVSLLMPFFATKSPWPASHLKIVYLQGQRR